MCQERRTHVRTDVTKTRDGTKAGRPAPSRLLKSGIRAGLLEEPKNRADCECDGGADCMGITSNEAEEAGASSLFCVRTLLFYNLHLRRVSLFGQIAVVNCRWLVQLENQGVLFWKSYIL